MTDNHLDIIHDFSYELEYMTRNINEIKDIAELEDRYMYYADMLQCIFRNLINLKKEHQNANK